MTEDLISRQAVLDAIYACYIGGKEAVDKAPANDQYAEGIDEAVRAVEQLPPVTPQPKVGHWIDCDDAISRQALLDALHARFGVDFDWNKWWSSTHVLAAIESVPPVTPPEPKTGHWKDVYLDDRDEWIMFSCGSCGHRFGCGWRYGDKIPWKYCPNCGARMEESEDAPKKYFEKFEAYNIPDNTVDARKMADAREKWIDYGNFIRQTEERLLEYAERLERLKEGGDGLSD